MLLLVVSNMSCYKLTYRSESSPLKVGYNTMEINKKGCVGLYRYGFNGYEKDDEIKGIGNHIDFGARGYDPRVGRWLSLDPMASKYPEVSPYVFANSNPIIFIDRDGNEWVNAHTARIQKLEKQLLDNPDDKKLMQQITNEQKLEARVNDYISNLKENDKALYDYIDNLKVEDASGNERNVKVHVSADRRNRGNQGQKADTRFHKYTDVPNVKYGDKDIVAPKSKHGIPSFDVTIYGNSTWGDERLANEAGDVMFYMEYNQESLREGGNAQYFEPGGGGMDDYLNSPSGDYSNRVQEVYRDRKSSGEGQNPESNPYPLERK